MPFESERQRKYLHANEPELAERWEHEMKSQGKDPYGNNSRNTSGDTYDELWRDSATPFVSPTPTGLPQGFDGPTEDVGLSTMGTAVHVTPDQSVMTRFKYGPANSNSMTGGEDTPPASGI